MRARVNSTSARWTPISALATTRGSTASLLIPMMLAITLSTTLAGRSMARTGRYKRFPVAGLGLMTVSLAYLSVAAGQPSRTTIGLGIALFGFGFAMVTQVLIVAVGQALQLGLSRLGTAAAS